MERAVRILGTGKYLPERRVRAEELDIRLGLEAGTVARKSGVHERRVIAPGETTSIMGAKAARAALDAANVKLEDIDAIVCGAALPEQLIPCTASLVQRELGLHMSGITCFDVNSTCLSWLNALDLMSHAVAAGQYNKVLIIASEAATPALNWKHLESSTLFGDGAAAAVIGRSAPGESSRILSSHMETYSAGADHCRIVGGGSKRYGAQYAAQHGEDFLFFMDGTSVFKMALQLTPAFIQRLLGRARAVLSDIKMFIPHQASGSGMSLMRKKLEVPEDRWMDILANHGNCIAASIPMALHEAIVQKRVQRGDLMMLCGTGAGFCLAGVILEY